MSARTGALDPFEVLKSAVSELADERRCIELLDSDETLDELDNSEALDELRMIADKILFLETAWSEVLWLEDDWTRPPKVSSMTVTRHSPGCR